MPWSLVVLPTITADLAAAMMTLTRLPVPASWPSGAPRSEGLWAFSFVGLLVGAIGGGVLGLGHMLGLPPGLAALAAIVATMLATGALHEDGLADFVDGVGGGRTRERKLEIMRDSRIGVYGALALGVSLLWRWSALSAIADPADAVTALIIAHTGARALMGLPLAVLAPARTDGVAASLGAPDAMNCLAVAALPALLMIWAWGWSAFPVMIVALLGVAAVTALAHHYLAGYTGDALGASQQVAEMAILAAALGTQAVR